MKIHERKMQAVKLAVWLIMRGAENNGIHKDKDGQRHKN